MPFPDTVLPLAVGQPRSVALVNDTLGSNRLIVMVASRVDGDMVDAATKRLAEGVLARSADRVREKQ